MTSVIDAVQEALAPLDFWCSSDDERRGDHCHLGGTTCTFPDFNPGARNGGRRVLQPALRFDGDPPDTIGRRGNDAYNRNAPWKDLEVRLLPREQTTWAIMWPCFQSQHDEQYEVCPIDSRGCQCGQHTQRDCATICGMARYTSGDDWRQCMHYCDEAPLCPPDCRHPIAVPMQPGRLGNLIAALVMEARAYTCQPWANLPCRGKGWTVDGIERDGYFDGKYQQWNIQRITWEPGLRLPSRPIYDDPGYAENLAHKDLALRYVAEHAAEFGVDQVRVRSPYRYSELDLWESGWNTGGERDPDELPAFAQIEGRSRSGCRIVADLVIAGIAAQMSLLIYRAVGSAPPGSAGRQGPPEFGETATRWLAPAVQLALSVRIGYRARVEPPCTWTDPETGERVDVEITSGVEEYPRTNVPGDQIWFETDGGAFFRPPRLAQWRGERSPHSDPPWAVYAAETRLGVDCDHLREVLLRDHVVAPKRMVYSGGIEGSGLGGPGNLYGGRAVLTRMGG